MLDADVIARNVEEVRENIIRAAQRAGRDPAGVRLVAATKSVPPDRIRSAVEAGVQILGENRLQDAVPKIEALRQAAAGLSWHFIGRLQRRKVRTVVGLFELIHSVDSLDLAAEIDRRAGEAGVRQKVLLEVNVGGEASKAGVAPAALPEALKALEAMPNLMVSGLMTVPPLSADPEQARPYFRELRLLAQSLAQATLERITLSELSMGMSSDYAVAVEEGATFVRIGTAIFGARRG
jgi:pyridoxal phosphate enzyme (YggS family)